MSGFEPAAEKLPVARNAVGKRGPVMAVLPHTATALETGREVTPGHLSSVPGQGLTSASLVVLSLLPEISMWGHGSSWLLPQGFLVFLEKKKKIEENHQQYQLKKFVEHVQGRSERCAEDLYTSRNRPEAPPRSCLAQTDAAPAALLGAGCLGSLAASAGSSASQHPALQQCHPAHPGTGASLSVLETFRPRIPRTGLSL